MITAALSAACFFWGRASVDTSIPLPIRAEINIDSMKSAWIQGKVDSVQLVDLFSRNEQLRYLIARLKHTTEHDTVYRIDTLPYIPTVNFDTTLSTTVRLYLQMQDDTLSTFNKTDVHLNAQYIGKPFYSLYLNNLSIDPIKQSIPYKEKVAESAPAGNLFSLSGLLGYGQQGMGAGAYAQVGMFGGGMLLQYDSKPFYFVSVRLIK